MNIKRYKKTISIYKIKVRINGGVSMNTNIIQRHCTPKESLKNALYEMKLMREGKVEKQSFWDMMKELDKEDE